MGLSDKVVSGDRLRIKAADWNAILDAARTASDPTRFGASASEVTRNSTSCKIKNTSGADQPRFAVLGLGAPIILPSDSEMEFKRQLTFDGTLPVAGTHEGKFAVLLSPLADGAIGDAVLGGVTHCKLAVDVLDSVFGWAEIADGVTGTLANVKVGSARVLWAEATGLERWALVRLADGTTARAVVTQVTWTADQTDYLLPADTTDLIVESMNAAHTLHSILAWQDGRTIRIHNASAFDLFLDAETGTVGAWFAIASGETVRIMPGEGLTVTWTAEQNSWQIMDKPGVLLRNVGAGSGGFGTDTILCDSSTGITATQTGPNEMTISFAGGFPGPVTFEDDVTFEAIVAFLSTVAFSNTTTFANFANFANYVNHAVKHVTWGTDQTDYFLPDDCSYLIVDLTADVQLNSIAGNNLAVGQTGRRVCIINKNTNFFLGLTNDDGATGTAANRIRVPGAADAFLIDYEGIELIYSPTDSRWYAPDTEQGGGVAGADELVKVSVTDTNNDYLSSKVTGYVEPFHSAAVLAPVIVDPAGDELLGLSVDLRASFYHTLLQKTVNAPGALYPIRGGVNQALSATLDDAITTAGVVYWLSYCDVPSGNATADGSLVDAEIAPRSKIGQLVDTTPVSLLYGSSPAVSTKLRSLIFRNGDSVDATVNLYSTEGFDPASGFPGGGVGIVDRDHLFKITLEPGDHLFIANGRRPCVLDRAGRRKVVLA